VAFWDEQKQDYSKRRSTGQTSEAAADAQARKWLTEGIPGMYREPFYDYLKRFWADDGDYVKRNRLRGRNLSNQYLVGMRGNVTKHVLPYLENKKRENMLLDQVTVGLLEGLILHLSETTELTARHINSIRQSVSVALSEAKRLGLIRHNPMIDVLKLREEKPKREILSIEEAKKVLSYDWKDERLRLINMLAAATGMRLGECRGLQIEDLVQDGEMWCINVQHNWQEIDGMKEPKWGSRRKIPLPSAIASALLELYVVNPWQNGFIFPGYTSDAPISKRSVRESFNKAIIASEISEEERRRRRLTFHSWRHWYDSYLRGQVPDHVIQGLTGHKSDRMMERYSHVTDEQRRAVAELGEKLF